MKSLRYAVLLILSCLSSVSSMAEPFRLPMQTSKLARLETKMWQAYYEKDYVHLSYRIYQLFSEEFPLSTTTAIRAAYHATKAAKIMRSLPHETSREMYQQHIVPHLTRFFEVIKPDLKANYDARLLAIAELDWWITRRTNQRDDLEKIGGQIAEVYRLMSQRDNEAIRKAGYLRAKAAWLRDEQNSQGTVDWARIELLLRQSYQYLAQGIAE